MKSYLNITLLFLSLLQAVFLPGGRLYARPVANAEVQWQRLTNDEAFSYKDKKEVVKKTERNANFVSELFNLIFGFFTSALGKTLLWILFFIFVGWTLFKVFFDERFFAFSSKKKKEPEETTDTEAELLDINWEQRMNKAMQEGNLPLAIKYSYLHLLQLLQQKELILFRDDKTNNDYYHELKDGNIKRPFRQLSRQYEYVWYGQYPLSQQQYDAYMSTFQTLKNSLPAR